jgi:hypothetical protein
MVDYSPDTWSETAFVAISAKGGSEHEFMTITETVDLKIGDKDIDVVNTLAGGRLVKFNPQDVSEVTLEAYPVKANSVGIAGTAGEGFADLINTSSDSTQPLSVSNDRTRQKIRAVVAWTNSPYTTCATNSITGTAAAFRISLKGGYMTSYQESFTDGVKKATITMKFPAFDKAGASNITFESTDGNGSLPAISAYS